MADINVIISDIVRYEKSMPTTVIQISMEHISVTFHFSSETDFTIQHSRLEKMFANMAFFVPVDKSSRYTKIQLSYESEMWLEAFVEGFCKQT